MVTGNDSPTPRKDRLIGSAVDLMLRQGYAATSVDQICSCAEVTKGSFFHYFPSKEAIAHTAMEAWSASWERIQGDAGLATEPDPLARLGRFFEVMATTYLNPELPPGCLVGTIAQEASLASETVREACEGHLDRWREGTVRLLSDARDAYPPVIDFEPSEVAEMMLAIVQGSLLVAKTRRNRDFVAVNLRHCQRYVESLFGRRLPGVETGQPGKGLEEMNP